MNLESKRIWFRLKSEEYIIIDTVNEAWAAAYNDTYLGTYQYYNTNYYRKICR